ncbi:enoyl-CoA hydratase/isomerase family protein [Demetria terragena]|uniref:enoyl-CoA hydratase/isomerase family protein n=1 Tax=Demetria terragena TaxID=63959 RepID=UPI00035D91CD|nr:enoyl-CoA hydratase-related protein [Demetria terragena]
MTDLTDPTSAVVLSRDGGVATIRFNRPDAMNSVNLATKEALLAALREVAEDSSVRAVVLTGSGRAFCVGQDLREHVAGLKSGEKLDSTVADHYNPAVTLIATMNKPVIAALNGVAAGAGSSLAFAADFRILVDSAGFNLAFAGIALSCDTGASWTLPRLVGVAKAKELLMFGGTISAQEALDYGLATKIVPADEFDSAVSEFALKLASGPTLAYGSIRRAVTFSVGNDLADSLAHEAELMALTGASADHRAAVEAFLAKEKPSFEGR